MQRFRGPLAKIQIHGCFALALAALECKTELTGRNLEWTVMLDAGYVLCSRGGLGQN